MEAIKQYASGGHAAIKYAVGEIDIYGNTCHDYNEIYLLLHGETEYVSSHTRQTVFPGQIVVIPAGEYHQFLVSSDIQSYERCILHVWSGLLPDPILKSAVSSEKILVFPSEHRIYSHFRYLMQSLSSCSKEDFSYLLPSVVTDILFLIKHSYKEETISPGKLRPASLKIMKLIDAHYKEALQVEDIAKMCYLSVSSVSHIFKEDFGISIKKYMMQKRMIVAHQMLLAGKSVKEVSASTGFADYSVFYRAYRQYFHLSPSQTKPEKQNTHETPLAPTP